MKNLKRGFREWSKEEFENINQKKISIVQRISQLDKLHEERSDDFGRK